MALKNPFRRSDKDKANMENRALNDEQASATPDTPSTEEEQATAKADTAADAGDPAAVAELEALRTEHGALHDKHVRLFAEFDNFRKRTAKERIELLQTAGAGAITSLLPVLDDMERAITNNQGVEDPATLKQGFELVQQKFTNILAMQGVKQMQAKGEPFDPELHEAITKVPAPAPELKGKVVEVIANGYLMNDKVIRYAKVVVGE